ncbi:hypothetical protein [Flavobacterium sp. U410]
MLNRKIKTKINDFLQKKRVDIPIIINNNINYETDFHPIDIEELKDKLKKINRIK